MNRFIPILCVLLLSSCGFQPLQGVDYKSSLDVDLTSLNINVNQAIVQASNSGAGMVSSVPRRYGELFKAELKDRVNPMNVAAEKLFNLDISYSESEVATFVRPDGTASRGNLIYSSNYVITRIRDQKVVASGMIMSLGSFNSLPSADYASYISIEDARKRAALDMAQTYQLRLATLLPTLNGKTAPVIEKKDDSTPVLQPLRGYQ